MIKLLKKNNIIKLFCFNSIPKNIYQQTSINDKYSFLLYYKFLFMTIK